MKTEVEEMQERLLAAAAQGDSGYRKLCDTSKYPQASTGKLIGAIALQAATMTQLPLIITQCVMEGDVEAVRHYESLLVEIQKAMDATVDEINRRLPYTPPPEG